MRRRTPEGSGCFRNPALGSGRCPDGLSLAAWPGWVPQKSLLSAKELKMSQVRSLNTWPAGAQSVRRHLHGLPAGSRRGHLRGSAFSAWAGGRSLPPYWSLRAEGTEGPGSLLASATGSIPLGTGSQESAPIHSSLGQSFQRGDSSVHGAQKLSDPLKLLLCRMPFGKQLFPPTLFSQCSGNFCWIRLKMRPVSWQREGRGV